MLASSVPILSDLPSRYAIAVCFAKARENAAGGATSLLCIGIDNAVLVNQSLGYFIGDAYLQQIACRILQCQRPNEVLLRHSDHAFALVVGGVGASAALDRCENLVDALTAPVVIDGLSIQPRCTIGASVFPADGYDPSALLRFADIALSAARRRGTGVPVFYSEELGRKLAERLDAESAVQLALVEQQLSVSYECVVVPATGRLHSLIAQIWWRDQNAQRISARNYFSIGAESTADQALIEAQLRLVALHLRSWRSAGMPPTPISLAVPFHSLRHKRLLTRLRAAVTELGLLPGQVILDITEQSLPASLASCVDLVMELKDLGFRVAIDGFGAGHALMSQFAALGLEYLRLAPGAAASLLSAPSGDDKGQGLVALARAFGVQLALCHVDTPEQADAMLRAGCALASGACFGSALAPDAVPAAVGSGMVAAALIPSQTNEKRRLLLVDDEQNILSALKRLLRRDGYLIYTAASGAEALALLDTTEVDVIVSDQRMPGMLGADFLRAARLKYADTVRIMLSGYTELQSVTDAVNEGAIYKFLTKPWDDELLRGHIKEAFRIKESADENRRLSGALGGLNEQLASANRQLKELLNERQQRLLHDEISLGVAQEALRLVPVPVLGVDDSGVVVLANAAAEHLWAEQGFILGRPLESLAPGLGIDVDTVRPVDIGDRRFHAAIQRMGEHTRARGVLVSLLTRED
jgi:diguanylate cyclase (GGDEF)-like protein